MFPGLPGVFLENPSEGPEIEKSHSRSDAWKKKKTFSHARKNHSRLKFSFSVWNFHSRLKFSIPGLGFLRPESQRGSEWKNHSRLKISFCIESLIFSILPLEIENFSPLSSQHKLQLPLSCGIVRSPSSYRWKTREHQEIDKISVPSTSKSGERRRLGSKKRQIYWIWVSLFYLRVSLFTYGWSLLLTVNWLGLFTYGLLFCAYGGN